MSIHWYQLLFQIVNFSILLFVLKKFLYQPIINLIEMRNRKIEDSLKAAEDTLKEKAKIEIIKQKVIAEAEKETVVIIEAAKNKASQIGKQILESAKDQADQEVKKKLQLMTDKLNQQEAQITGRITDLVIKTTSQILKNSLTKKEQSRIIDAEINQLAKFK